MVWRHQRVIVQYDPWARFGGLPAGRPGPEGPEDPEGGKLPAGLSSFRGWSLQCAWKAHARNQLYAVVRIACMCRVQVCVCVVSCTEVLSRDCLCACVATSCRTADDHSILCLHSNSSLRLSSLLTSKGHNLMTDRERSLHPRRKAQKQDAGGERVRPASMVRHGCCVADARNPEASETVVFTFACWLCPCHTIPIPSAFPRDLPAAPYSVRTRHGTPTLRLRMRIWSYEHKFSHHDA